MMGGTGGGDARADCSCSVMRERYSACVFSLFFHILQKRETGNRFCMQAAIHILHVLRNNLFFYCCLPYLRLSPAHLISHEP